MFGVIGFGCANVYIFTEHLINLINSHTHQKSQIEDAYQKLKASKEIQQKMESQAAYATLVRGICHDLRTPMNSISLAGQVIAADLARGDFDGVKLACDTLTKSTLRLDTMLVTMLKFGMEGMSERGSVSVNGVIESALQVSRHYFIDKNIEVVSKLGEIPEILANRSQLEQILTNFIINACEAMPEGGTITFETGRTRFWPKDSNGEVDGVYIKISDTGVGIPEENLNKIWNPFFTTKYGSTGLGLATALKIIAAHHGIPNVESAVGKGTTISLCLPLTHSVEKGR